MSRPSEYTYKSPPSKIIKLFREARDKWKQKSLDATTQIKYLKNRINFLETSKQKVKDQVKSLQAENQNLREQIVQLHPSQADDSKKKMKWV